MKKKINILIMILSFFLSHAQEKIEFRKNPYSNQNHFIIRLTKEPKTYSKKFYDVKQKIYRHGYKSPVVKVEDFKSITVNKRGNNYDLLLQLDADGVIDLDKVTSRYRERQYGFVFNDTLYQTKKYSSASYDGQFLIENVNENQKDKIINFYSALPSYDLQMKLYNAVRRNNFEKIDSLLKVGATLTEVNHETGYNKFDGAFFTVMNLRNSKKQPKYGVMADYLLEKGFEPKALTLKQAIVYDDIGFIKNNFEKIIDLKQRIKQLKSEVSKLFSRGSEEMFNEYERLGFNFRTEKYGKKNMLIQAIISTHKLTTIKYLLKKKVIYDKAPALVYSLMYSDIDITDLLLKDGADINYRFKGGNNIAQELILLEYSHGYNLGDVFLDKIPLMLERGFNPNTVGSNGKTLLHTIANKTSKFINHVTDVNAAYEVSEESEKVVAVVNLLKEKGLDSSIKEINGFTAHYYVKDILRQMKVKEEDLKAYVDAFKD